MMEEMKTVEEMRAEKLNHLLSDVVIQMSVRRLGFTNDAGETNVIVQQQLLHFNVHMFSSFFVLILFSVKI